jgi:TolB-like protein/Tfp pilus assembly protein PilF
MPTDSESDLRLEIGHVLFIDIVGYSKLLISEQSAQLEALKKIVRGTEQFRVAAAEGKLLRLPTGDGGALVFRTTPEAPVLCALEIGKELREHPGLEVRMGIHSGPVNEITDLNEQANIAGPGINIAQRVMDCGDAGHILVSKRVADDLAQYRHWQPYLHELGDCEVKHGMVISLVNLYTDEIGNPDKPERFRLIDRGSAADAVSEEKSIAVLPFIDLSQAKDQEYFCDGVSEEILGALAKVHGLRVAARTSSFSFKGKNAGADEIAKKLNVENILEGSLRREGDRVRINVELINGNDGFQVWSETYEREMRGIFALQDEITRAIMDALKVKLAIALPPQPQQNTEAYDLYLKGRFCWNKRTTVALKQAISYFKQAVEKDPTYALAYTGLADCYSSLGFSFDAGALAPREAIPKASAAASSALKLNPNLAETHTSLAFIKLTYEWDWAGAEEEFRRAIQLNPNYDNAHHWYSHHLLATGRIEESLAESKRALELDRLGLIINAHLGWHYLYSNEPDLAIEQFERTLELDPSYGLAHWYLGQAFNRKEMYGEALTELKKAKGLLKQNVGVEADIACTNALAGKESAARKILHELNQLSERKYVSSYHFALIYSALGARDQAFGCLARAWEERSDMMVHLGIDARLESLRHDPRFFDLLKRMALALPTRTKGADG